jgi:hypothetical protein
MEFTFLRLQLQVEYLESLENFFHMSYVFFFVVRVDQDVVQVCDSVVV